jgi:carbonic anhydrase
MRKRGNSAPGGGVIVISCSDPRIVPADYFKLNFGEMGVIRNAGGRAMDAIRSLVVLDTLVKIGTVIVVHHTDCGQTHVLDQEVKDGIISRHPELASDVEKMKFGEIRKEDLEKSLLEDIAILKESPLLRDEMNVRGFKLDIATGLLSEVKP